MESFRSHSLAWPLIGANYVDFVFISKSDCFLLPSGLKPLDIKSGSFQTKVQVPSTKKFLAESASEAFGTLFSTAEWLNPGKFNIV